MKKSLGLFLIPFLLAAAGCKLEHNSRVKQSQLLGALQTIEATVRIEVPGCNDFRNTSQPAEGLLKVNNMMQQLFPGSEFEGCKQEGMNSIATYIAPMEVGAMPPDAKEYQAKGVSLVRNVSGETFFCLSRAIAARVAKSRNDPMTQDIALNVSIRLSNDTDTDITIFPHAVFIDGAPFAGLPRWGNNVVIKAGKPVNIVLSNIASEYVIKHGAVPVFTEKAHMQKSATQ